MPKTKPAVISAVQPSATFEIDGKKLHLVYDYNAIAEAEAETGGTVNLLHGISALFLNTMSALQLRGLFYAALKPKQPTVTLAEAGSMIRINTLPQIMEAISAAWAASMPTESKANPPGAGTTPAAS